VYVLKIYLLTLLKISYEVGICLIVSVISMALITYIKGDKAYFRRKIDKFIKE
jgi:hypothetical protein